MDKYKLDMDMSFQQENPELYTQKLIINIKISCI